MTHWSPRIVCLERLHHEVLRLSVSTRLSCFIVSEEKNPRAKREKKEEEEQISKYRELLQGIQDKERKEKDHGMEMEITWVPGETSSSHSVRSWIGSAAATRV